MPPSDPQRRRVLAFLAASAAYAALPLPPSHAAAVSADADARAELADLERRHGGRLGVYIVDGDSPGQGLGHRQDERFALCSTFKLLLAAVVLREADAGRLDLETPLRFGKADLVPYAPVIEQHLAAGALSIGALAEATQITSDNVAANLLIQQLGGPEAVTARLRQMGDAVTRIDRLEPVMNRVLPGEERDTTTPKAMAESALRLFSSDRLAVASQQRLKDWMIRTRTGGRRLRAGFPAHWEAGDKTGTAYFEGAGNKVNDVAVIWREGRAPVAVAAYYEAAVYEPRIRAEDEAVLAAVGRLVARRFG